MKPYTTVQLNVKVTEISDGKDTMLNANRFMAVVDRYTDSGIDT